MTLSCVLDTSAVLTLLRNEHGASRVSSLIAPRCGFHRLHLGELYAVVRKRDGVAKARRVYGLVVSYPFRLLDDLGDPVLLTTGDLKAEFDLGFMDALAAATAMLNNTALVTGDNDFRPLERAGILRVVWV